MLSRKKQEELREQRASLNYPVAQIKRTSQETLEINGQSFVLVDNYRDALDIEALADRYMDILDIYDFVVGDWSYEQLRLKGFFADDAKIGSLEQKIKHLPDYLLEYGSFGAAYFVLLHERTGEEIQKRNEAFWTQQKHQNQESSRSKQNKKNTKTKNLQEEKKIKTKHKGQRVGNLTKGTKQTTDINRLGQTKIKRNTNSDGQTRSLKVLKGHLSQFHKIKSRIKIPKNKN